MTSYATAIRRFQSGLCFGIAAVISLLPADSVSAQGGPENVVVVVNAASDSSLMLANHYVHLRQIPASHVIHLTGVPAREFTNEKAFGDTVLQPVMQEISRRQLADCVDYVIYSSDFPTSINIPDTRQRFLELARQNGQTVNDAYKRAFNPVAASTALTYFASQFLNDDATLLLPNANRYMRVRTANGSYLPTRTFHAQQGWSPTGDPVAGDRGKQYLISSILTVTRNYGISEREALEWLQRTVAADGNPPSGTIYFANNPGPRTAPRRALFDDAISELEQLGISTRIIREKMPRDAEIAGLMAGAAEIDLPAFRSTISPGSICENLTSIGGKFIARIQLKCTEFLKQGAAGSSGAVTEPLAIAVKFPHPMIQVHYARGCTLGEAFYQSIHCPFQTLIVGDPLCRPWNRAPDFEIDAPPASQPVSDELAISIRYSESVPVARTQVYLDGVKIRDEPRLDRLVLDTREMIDGFHELRIIAVAEGPIEFNSRKIVPLNVDNAGQRVRLATPQESWQQTDTIELQVEATSGDRIIVYHGHREAGRLANRGGIISIPAKSLGRGPVRLQARAFSGEQLIAASPPLDLVVDGPISDSVPQPDIMNSRRKPAAGKGKDNR